MKDDFLIKINQILMYPFWSFIAKRVYRAEVNKKIKINKNDSCIFVSNHVGRFDPFLIFYSLPFKELIHILPIRFMTANIYMDTVAKRLPMRAMGCYQIDSDVLKKSKKLLRSNNLCIFMQGKIDPYYKQKPKVGAVYIHRECRGSYIVPVQVSLAPNFKVKFIDKIKNVKLGSDLQPFADSVLERIKNAK